MKKKSKSGGILSRKPAPNLHAVYEQMKAALPADLTPAEYTAACRRIAKVLRI